MTTGIESYLPSESFKRRVLGRASSPPTWACYEQIQGDDDDDDEYSESLSDEDSCSEDGEDYARVNHDHDSESGDTVHLGNEPQDDTQNMEIDRVGGGDAEKNPADFKKDIKGKQRAVDPEPQHTKRRHRIKQRPVYTPRPILTIQKSQGFVWNQDLFVPPYIKDRYVASTSPPNCDGFISNSWSSTCTKSSLNDYEVEVVEIRIKEGELFDIIP